MAKIITQETFDQVLQENIVEFSMSVEEARKETVEQLEAQGINLANIIKDLAINEATGVPKLNEAIENLKQHLEGTKTLETSELTKVLCLITDECNISVPHRVLASKLNALEYLQKLIDLEIASGESKTVNTILHHSILAANSMTNKQPDIFDEKCLNLIVKLLDTQKDKQVICDILKWIQKSCVLHEMNRQAIMNADLLMTHLKPLLLKDDKEVVKEVCAVFRFLILDDDVRVEFGKAHEHAKQIATEALTELVGLLPKYKDDKDMIADLLLTIASLTVRNEFCITVEEAQGLKYILDAMIQFPDSPKVAREAFKLLKALAGNDTVKVHIIQNYGAGTVITSALSRFKSNDGVVKAGLGCVSILALRVKENSKILFETGISETIIEIMKIHASNKVVQRNAAWAIRNMISRSRDQCETFINQGAEDVLNSAMQSHPSIAQDCKSALRDLGSKVHLNEEWTGKGEYQISN